MSFLCHFLIRNSDLFDIVLGTILRQKEQGKVASLSSPLLNSALFWWLTGVSHSKWFSCKDHGVFSPSLGLMPWALWGFLDLVSFLLGGGNGVSKFYPFSVLCASSAGRERNVDIKWLSSWFLPFSFKYLSPQVTHITYYVPIWTELLGFLFKKTWV